MKKDNTIMIQILITSLIAILSVSNLMKVFNHEQVNVFGYISYVFNIIAIIAIIISWLSIARNKNIK